MVWKRERKTNKMFVCVCMRVLLRVIRECTYVREHACVFAYVCVCVWECVRACVCVYMIVHVM